MRLPLVAIAIGNSFKNNGHALRHGKGEPAMRSARRRRRQLRHHLEDQLDIALVLREVLLNAVAVIEREASFEGLCLGVIPHLLV